MLFHTPCRLDPRFVGFALVLVLSPLVSCGGDSGTTDPEPPVATTVVIAPASRTLTAIGETAQLSAEVRDQNGQVMGGAGVTWNSEAPTVASVTPAGMVTALADGSATITASSGSATGTAVMTVSLPPIESVEVSGAGRVKVGVAYQYTAAARLGDGTVVDRPMTWSISPPSKGTMTADGTLTPLETGVISLRVTIDGTVWATEITAYDWVSLSGSGSLFLSLDADVEITNQFGTSELPGLVFACSQDGNFFAWVDTESFVTASGLVSFIFGEGEATSQTWIEFDDFSALGHPGPTNLQTKNFALAMAAVSEFYFAFTEFRGSVKATLFRVTGLANLLPALLDACPSNSLATPSEAAAAVQAYRSLRGSPPAILDPSVQHHRQLRAEAGPDDAAVPSLAAVQPSSTRTWRMRRR